MKIVVIPRTIDLRIIVDPVDGVNIESALSVIPGAYDHWPEAKDKGFVEMEIAGNTLRALLKEISDRYHRSGINIGPICPVTNDVKNTYDVYVNDKNYVRTPHGLDTILNKDDEVKIIEDTILS
jgi:molybdopterin converting factor small subunit